MGLRVALRGKRVYFDAMVFIYLVEGFAQLGRALDEIRDSLESGEAEAVTSELTLCETLVRPFAANNAALVTRYRQFIEASGAFALLPATRETYVRASLYRAQFGLKTPDAIHMASAVGAQCQVFLSNDAAIRAPREIRVVPMRGG